MASLEGGAEQEVATRLSYQMTGPIASIGYQGGPVSTHPLGSFQCSAGLAYMVCGFVKDVPSFETSPSFRAKARALAGEYGVSIMLQPIATGNTIIYFSTSLGILDPAITLQCIRAAMKAVIAVDPENGATKMAGEQREALAARKFIRKHASSRCELTAGRVTPVEALWVSHVAVAVSRIAANPAFAMAVARQLRTDIGLSSLLESTVLNLTSDLLLSIWMHGYLNALAVPISRWYYAKLNPKSSNDPKLSEIFKEDESRAFGTGLLMQFLQFPFSLRAYRAIAGMQTPPSAGHAIYGFGTAAGVANGVVDGGSCTAGSTSSAPIVGLFKGLFCFQPPFAWYQWLTVVPLVLTWPLCLLPGGPFQQTDAYAAHVCHHVVHAAAHVLLRNTVWPWLVGAIGGVAADFNWLALWSSRVASRSAFYIGRHGWGASGEHLRDASRISHLTYSPLTSDFGLAYLMLNAMATVVSYPLQTLAARLACASVAGELPLKGGARAVLHTANEIVRNEGVSALYAGIGWLLVGQIIRYVASETIYSMQNTLAKTKATLAPAADATETYRYDETTQCETTQ